MNQLIRFFSQILLLIIFIWSIKTTHAKVNYKLTSVVRDFAGNLSLWTGKGQVAVEFGVGWCNDSLGWLFDLDLNHTWNRYTISSITWSPIDCSFKYQPGIIKLINNHTFDGYINQFGDRLKKWLAGPDGIYGTDDDRRVYLRPGMKVDKIVLFNKKIASIK